MKHCLAIDIGASSGQCLIGTRDKYDNKKIITEDIYRFDNVQKRHKNAVCWNIEVILAHVLSGMKRCAGIKKIPVGIGLDSWGVDFILLDKKGKILGDAVTYRDQRTKGMDAIVHELIPEAEHYTRTGINKYIYNTIYQLMAVKTKTPELLEKADKLLFIPDYIRYRLCGAIACEYTMATTTGLINAEQKDWDDEIISRLGFPRKIFLPLKKPGGVVGTLTEEVIEKVGYDCKVMLPPAHDTACAFYSVSEENNIILSSGTWSIIGAKIPKPIVTKEAYECGFTNEGADDGNIRFLKNIMGLWMVQQVKKEIGGHYGYIELINMAEESSYSGTVDANDNSFFAPTSMVTAIKEKCVEAGFPAPQSTGDIILCICKSLAIAYAKAVKNLTRLTGQKFEAITIIGGGSRNSLLSKLTEEECGLPVHIGYAESTALGNLMYQLK